MRPVPKARHTIAIAVFLAVSTAAGFLAAMEDHLSQQQANMAVNMVRAVEGDLYARDAIFGASGLWRLHNPVWRWYLCEAYRATDGADVKLPFSMAAGPLTFVYLVGMYGLLWRQCRSWSIACYTSVLSVAVILVAAGAHWGLGPLQTMTPETVVLAFAPLLIWVFTARRDSPTVLWVFLAVGLLANIHVGAAMNLAAVLGLVLLAHRRFTWRGWRVAIAGGLCAAAAASPILWYYAAQRAAFNGGGPLRWATAGLIPLSTGAGGLAAMLSEALEFPSLGYLLALGLPALAVMIRSERFRVRDLGDWVWFLIAAAAVAMVIQGVVETVGPLYGARSVTVGFVHAIRLVLVPLYVLFAQGAVHLFRSGASRHTLRVAMTVFALLWLAPSDNLAVPRHGVEAAAFRALPEAERPENIQNRDDRAAGRRELRAISQWLATHTPTDTVVACVDARVRLWARRALVVGWTDLPYYSYLAPDGRRPWRRRLTEQTDLLIPRRGGAAGAAKLNQFARRYGASYIILAAASAPPANAPDVWAGPTDPRWGEHWVLYRPAGPTTADPTNAAPSTTAE